MSHKNISKIEFKAMTLRAKGVAFTGQWTLLTFQANSWGSSGEDNEMCVYLVDLHFGIFFQKASSIVHSCLKPWFEDLV